VDARHHGGAWLVRIEDLDPPREDPGAAAAILRSLQCHGLLWDREVLYQSTRESAYATTLRELTLADHVFFCDCSRATLGPDGACQGECRSRQSHIATPHAVRVNVKAGCQIQFNDRLQGPQYSDLGKDLPDFVVRRKDGLTAYQLAVIVDDAEQGITHVVRGSDLLDSTPRQIYLQQLLGYATPQYCHFPVITHVNGQKFSKQNQSPALVNADATRNLRNALRFLHQPQPPTALTGVQQILEHAVEHWSIQPIPATLSISAADHDLIC
jgi:glutamyl-Q tRNA(Asp) synthetase